MFFSEWYFVFCEKAPASTQMEIAAATSHLPVRRLIFLNLRAAPFIPLLFILGNALKVRFNLLVTYEM